mgnify:CR=1 FL=1
MPVSHMAKYFNVSTPLILNRINENGFEKLFPVKDEISVEEITNLLEKGESMSSVGRILGINNQMVKTILKRNGIPFKYKSQKIEEENKMEMIRLYEEGKSISEISRMFNNLNRRNVTRIVKSN